MLFIVKAFIVTFDQFIAPLLNKSIKSSYWPQRFFFVLKQIHMKTMPAAMFRLLTGQETPLYIWSEVDFSWDTQLWARGNVWMQQSPFSFYLHQK